MARRPQPIETNDAVARDMLRGFVGEIEASDDRIASENKHKSAIYKRAKDKGFNVKALRKVIAARRMDEVDRNKLEGDFDLYWITVADLAHAHVEIIDEIDADDEVDHDPETGEIIETKTAVSPVAADPAEGLSPNKTAPSADQSRPLGTTAQPPADAGTTSLAGAEGDEDRQHVQPSESPALKTEAEASAPHSPHAEADQADSGPQAAVGLSNSPEGANEVPAQDSGGSEARSESEGAREPFRKPNAALPASVDADANDDARRGEIGNKVETAGETATISETAGPTVAPGGEGHAVAPALSATLTRPDGCREPNACHSSTWRKLCHECSTAKAANVAPVGLTIGAADIPHEGQVH